MINYRIRSISLLNLVNDLRQERLIPNAYFQRNLVWREIHKKDFIKTILDEYPFPQIFISKGEIDIANMSTVSCIVDGQQRCNAICEFIKDELEVNGKLYSSLSENEKSNFLKYEIAVIELDLSNNDPKVRDIFQRINRTSSSLSNIEKLASEYSNSEFMLVAKLLANQISVTRKDSDDLDDYEIYEDNNENMNRTDFRENPLISPEFYSWASKQKVKHFQNLITEKGVFGPQELARKTNLLHILNLMTTLLEGYFNRNDKVLGLLDRYSHQFSQRDELVKKLEQSAIVIIKMKFTKTSYWMNKANIFSLIITIAKLHDMGHKIDPTKARNELAYFSKNLPDDYKNAAKEGVNSKISRSIRSNNLFLILQKATIPNQNIN